MCQVRWSVLEEKLLDENWTTSSLGYTILSELASDLLMHAQPQNHPKPRDGRPEWAAAIGWFDGAATRTTVLTLQTSIAFL